MWCKKEKEKRKCLKIKHLRFAGYPEPGSNRHGLLHWCLRPARLPIPPSGLVCFSVALGSLAFRFCLSGAAVQRFKRLPIRSERGTGRVDLPVRFAKVSDFSEFAK